MFAKRARTKSESTSRKLSSRKSRRKAQGVPGRGSKSAAVTALSLLFLMAGAYANAADEEPAVKLFQSVNGCVVALENLEGGGTGFIIDKSGLILTNAHVVASPLPYKCKIDVRKGGKLETVVFKKVKIIGTHPDKDLALVRVDPKEHNVQFQVARMTKVKPSPGQRVYAIGNPAGGEGIVLEKTITAGMLSGVNRVIEKVAYYQIDAAINPGNSGGPLFNAAGEVVGVVTLKFTDVENTGFALPVADLDTGKFVPMRERRGDPEQARAVLAKAGEFYERYQRYHRTNPGSDEEWESLYKSLRFYHLALTLDPSNDATYYNFGMLLNKIGKHEIAVAYLTQAIEINPWEKERQPGAGLYYSELGLALAKQEKFKEARAVWEEGLAKHPNTGTLWENMAMVCADLNDPAGSAYHAQVALKLGPTEKRRGELTRVLQAMQRELNPAQKKKLDGDVAGITADLKRRQTEAEKQRKSKKDYLTKAFTEYLGGEGNYVDKVTDKAPQVVVSNTTEAAAAPAEGEAGEPVKKVTLPPGAVDLLRNVSARQDAFKGTWTEDDNGIVSPAVPCARIKFPAKVPEEYDLLLVLERQSNKGEFVVGFVRGGKQSVFYFDAERAKVSGLDIASRDCYQQPVFTNGKPATVVMKVRKEGLLVSVDSKRIFTLRSTDPFPAVPEEWDVRDDTKLFVGAEGSRYRIYQAAIKEFQRP